MKITLTAPRIVRVLKKVPEKKFRIMELAPQLVDDNGHVDVVKAVDRQTELNLAIIEVESYVRATKDIVRVLQRMSSREPGPDDFYGEEDIEVGDED